MFKKAVSIFLVAAFTLFNVVTSVRAQALPNSVNLPVPGTMLVSSPAYFPVLLKGLEVHPEDPLMFDFILDTGDTELDAVQLEEESAKLVRYFLAALTVPEEEMWVNLSPYEENRIVPDSFGRTEMGRDLLAQDYILKQLSASLMYPEDELGKKFWERVYNRARAEYGSVDIPMNTFNKIWILPQTASVYEYEKGVFMVEGRLKVMLEEDYLALEMNQGSTKHGLGNATKDDLDVVTGITAQVVREVLIPEIEREVNEGEYFANLRQIYNAMVLATWYKERLNQSLLGRVYVNQKKTTGIQLEDSEANARIYRQYVEAFKKGVYDYIKEDYDAVSQKIVEKKYFSGGATASGLKRDLAMLGGGDADRVRAAAVPQGKALRVTAGIRGVFTSADNAMLAVLPRVNPTTTESWAKLKALAAQRQARYDLRALFGADEARAGRLSFALADDFEVDFSKNLIDEETLAVLLELARETSLDRAIEQMFKGEKINETEGRAVLHTALRNVTRRDGELVAANGQVYVDGEDVMPQVIAVLKKMEAFTQKVRSGEWKGATGKSIRHVVNVGIGGSDLGPKMAAEALRAYGRDSGISVHFLSNIDGTAAAELMRQLDPEETLVVIESKTFTTQETIQNAATLKRWVSSHYASNPDVTSQDAIRKHFVAVSTAKKLVEDFGIDPENMFEFWDWVGGRYSVWSAIGLTLATYVGFDNFLEMLEGAREVDEHFRSQPFEKNIPVLKALLGIWYGNFLNAESFAILPYDQYLSLFPAFAQQFFMESNGKSTDRNGNPITGYQTGQIVWGAAGTDGQHSFYQLIHQGTRLVPADFIGVARSQNPLPGHHEKFYSNFIAQPVALAFGARLEEVKAALAAKGGLDEEELAWHAAQRTFEGNKPTTSILIDEMDPRALGRLTALYEHQIMAEGVMLNVFSFDQWGVELGKKVATGSVLPYIDGSRPSGELLAQERGGVIKRDVDRFNDRQRRDGAMLGKDPVGGIDLNADALDLHTSNAGKFDFPEPTPQMIESLRGAIGFAPAIIQIQPIINLPLILGFAGSEEAGPYADGGGADFPARPTAAYFDRRVFGS